MKLYLLGGTGLLGSCFRRYSSHSLEVVSRSSESTLSYDQIVKYRFKKGDKLVHMGWPTNLLHCQSYDFDDLFDFTRSIFASASSQCIPFIFISTDQVYSSAHKGHLETELCQPLNKYGSSKLFAEDIALNFGGTVCRLNYVSNDHDLKGRGWIEFLRKSALNNKKIELFDNSIYSPCSGEFAVSAISKLLEKNTTGIFNLGSQESFSKAKLSIAYLSQSFPEFNNYTCKNASIYPDSIPRNNQLGMDTTLLSNVISMQTESLAQIVSTLL